VYGIGKSRSVDEWRHLTRSLTHQGLLDETQDGYPVLLLNVKSWEVLRGERRVEIAAAPKPARAKKSSSAGAAAPTAGDYELFEALRALRKKLADQNGLPPYVIFHDASLREMAQRKPVTIADFATVPGVGQTKLLRYGEPFIEIIREHLPG
jgi:ATP-dependent DNA helicase RecQ